MSEEQESRDVEPEQPTGHPSEGTKPRNALSRVIREVSDEELSSPGARKLLIDKLDNLELQVAELTPYRERFHEADKQVAVLQARFRKSTASEILYGFALAAGAALISLASSAWTTLPYSSAFLVLGIALMLSAGVFKVLET
jgi:hypothetical protein